MASFISGHFACFIPTYFLIANPRRFMSSTVISQKRKKKHRPNKIPLKTRVFLAICTLFLLVFILVELALGYTYLPGKRGGFLLSGVPTLLIALSASGLLLAAVLTIIDHYDKRPNEASYKSLRSFCLKASLYLLIAAPIFEITESLLHLNGIDLFPRFHGIAETYSLHSAKLKTYVQYLSPILNNATTIGVLSAFTIGLGLLVEKLFVKRANRFVMLMAGIGILGLSTMWIAETAKDFLLGEVTIGRRSSKLIVQADLEPAKFNAILLTHFSLGGFMFVSSAFVVIGVITNRIKPI